MQLDFAGPPAVVRGDPGDPHECAPLLHLRHRWQAVAERRKCDCRATTVASLWLERHCRDKRWMAGLLLRFIEYRAAIEWRVEPEGDVSLDHRHAQPLSL